MPPMFSRSEKMSIIILREKRHVGIYKQYLKSEKHWKVCLAAPSPNALGRALLKSEIRVGEQSRNVVVLFITLVDLVFIL